MDLRNKINFPMNIVLPDIFKNKFGVCTNCELTDQEIIVFNKALYAVSQQLIQEGITSSDIEKFTTIFTLNGELSFYEQHDDACGVRFNMAVYMMENIRKKNSNIFMLFAFIEEMAHYYWHTSDETFVKYKVAEIIQHIYPDFTLDYMRKRWDLNGL